MQNNNKTSQSSCLTCPYSAKTNDCHFEKKYQCGLKVSCENYYLNDTYPDHEVSEFFSENTENPTLIDDCELETKQHFSSTPPSFNSSHKMDIDCTENDTDRKSSSSQNSQDDNTKQLYIESSVDLKRKITFAEPVCEFNCADISTKAADESEPIIKDINNNDDDEICVSKLNSKEELLDSDSRKCEEELTLTIPSLSSSKHDSKSDDQTIEAAMEKQDNSLSEPVVSRQSSEVKGNYDYCSKEKINLTKNTTSDTFIQTKTPTKVAECVSNLEKIVLSKCSSSEKRIVTVNTTALKIWSPDIKCKSKTDNSDSFDESYEHDDDVDYFSDNGICEKFEIESVKNDGKNNVSIKCGQEMEGNQVESGVTSISDMNFNEDEEKNSLKCGEWKDNEKKNVTIGDETYGENGDKKNDDNNVEKYVEKDEKDEEINKNENDYELEKNYEKTDEIKESNHEEEETEKYDDDDDDDYDFIDNETKEIYNTNNVSSSSLLSLSTCNNKLEINSNKEYEDKSENNNSLQLRKSLSIHDDDIVAVDVGKEKKMSIIGKPCRPGTYFTHAKASSTSKAVGFPPSAPQVKNISVSESIETRAEHGRTPETIMDTYSVAITVPVDSNKMAFSNDDLMEKCANLDSSITSQSKDIMICEEYIEPKKNEFLPQQQQYFAMQCMGQRQQPDYGDFYCKGEKAINELEFACRLKRECGDDEDDDNNNSSDSITMNCISCCENNNDYCDIIEIGGGGGIKSYTSNGNNAVECCASLHSSNDDDICESNGMNNIDCYCCMEELSENKFDDVPSTVSKCYSSDIFPSIDDLSYSNLADECKKRREEEEEEAAVVLNNGGGGGVVNNRKNVNDCFDFSEQARIKKLIKCEAAASAGDITLASFRGRDSIGNMEEYSDEVTPSSLTTDDDLFKSNMVGEKSDDGCKKAQNASQMNNIEREDECRKMKLNECEKEIKDGQLNSFIELCDNPQIKNTTSVFPSKCCRCASGGGGGGELLETQLTLTDMEDEEVFCNDDDDNDDNNKNTKLKFCQDNNNEQGQADVVTENLTCACKSDDDVVFCCEEFIKKFYSAGVANETTDKQDKVSKCKRILRGGGGGGGRNKLEICEKLKEICTQTDLICQTTTTTATTSCETCKKGLKDGGDMDDCCESKTMMSCLEYLKDKKNRLEYNCSMFKFRIECSDDEKNGDGGGKLLNCGDLKYVFKSIRPNNYGSFKDNDKEADIRKGGGNNNVMDKERGEITECLSAFVNCIKKCQVDYYCKLNELDNDDMFLKKINSLIKNKKERESFNEILVGKSKEKQSSKDGNGGKNKKKSGGGGGGGRNKKRRNKNTTSTTSTTGTIVSYKRQSETCSLLSMPKMSLRSIHDDDDDDNNNRKELGMVKALKKGRRRKSSRNNSLISGGGGGGTNNFSCELSSSNSGGGGGSLSKKKKIGEKSIMKKKVLPPIERNRNGGIDKAGEKGGRKGSISSSNGSNKKKKSKNSQITPCNEDISSLVNSSSCMLQSSKVTLSGNCNTTLCCCNNILENEEEMHKKKEENNYDYDCDYDYYEEGGGKFNSKKTSVTFCNKEGDATLNSKNQSSFSFGIPNKTGMKNKPQLDDDDDDKVENGGEELIEELKKNKVSINNINNDEEAVDIINKVAGACVESDLRHVLARSVGTNVSLPCHVVENHNDDDDDDDLKIDKEMLLEEGYEYDEKKLRNVNKRFISNNNKKLDKPTPTTTTTKTTAPSSLLLQPVKTLCFSYDQFIDTPKRKNPWTREKKLLPPSRINNYSYDNNNNDDDNNNKNKQIIMPCLNNKIKPLEIEKEWRTNDECKKNNIKYGFIGSGPIAKNLLKCFSLCGDDHDNNDSNFCDDKDNDNNDNNNDNNPNHSFKKTNNNKNNNTNILFSKQERNAKYFEECGCKLVDSRRMVVEESSVLIFTVKSNCVKKLMEYLYCHDMRNKLIIVVLSVADDVSLSDMENATTPETVIFKVLINLPIIIQCGIAALSPCEKALNMDILFVKNLLKNIGLIEVVEERYLKPIQAIITTGLVITTTILEGLIDGCAKCDYDRGKALDLGACTLKGCAEMVLKDVDCELFNDEVILYRVPVLAALRQIENGKLKAVIVQCIQAAANN